MSPLTRFRIARSKVKLAKLLTEDHAARLGRTTRSLMDDVLARGHDIAILRHEIAKLEGTLPEADDSGGFDDRLPSGVYCPMSKPPRE